MYETIAPAEAPKKYTLRPANATDLFAMLNIVNAIGIDEFRACFQSDNVKKAMAGGGANLAEAVGTVVGFDMAMVLAKNIPKCEQDIYKFLSRLSGMEVEEIASLDLAIFAEMVIDVFKHDGFADFMRVVSQLFK